MLLRDTHTLKKKNPSSLVWTADYTLSNKFCSTLISNTAHPLRNSLITLIRFLVITSENSKLFSILQNSINVSCKQNPLLILEWVLSTRQTLNTCYHSMSKILDLYIYLSFPSSHEFQDFDYLRLSVHIMSTYQINIPWSFICTA